MSISSLIIATINGNLQYRITEILKKAPKPLKAGAIRAALNAEPEMVAITKSEVNKILYSMEKAGHVLMTGEPSGEALVGAPLWSLCSELKNEPSAEDLAEESAKYETGEPSSGWNAPQ